MSWFDFPWCTGRLMPHIGVCSARAANSLNYVRKPRFGNLLQSWSIAAANDGKAFKDFPELKPEEDMEKRVEWWNARIAERAGEDAPKVVAGAQMDILLNKRTGWLGF